MVSGADKMETGLSFDDILLAPRESSVLPEEVDTSTKITEDINLEKPVISSPMDKVTEYQMAIAIARQGGLGIIHRNLDTEEQIRHVKKVKRSENWVIENPKTIKPEEKIDKAKKIMETQNISGLPVVKENNELVGILTKRDLRFESDYQKKVKEQMSGKDELITAPPDTDMERAKQMLHENRIEKLPLVNESGRLEGLITIRDIEKKKEHPEATVDGNGQLMVGAAVGPKEFKKAERLVDAGVDLILIDTSHGHSENVVEGTEQMANSLDIGIMSGNVATEEGARALIDAEADSIRVGVGPGSICTTRIVSGVGVPQITAVMEASEALEETGADASIIADGGIRYSGDIAKSIACGAHAAMLGSLLAGTEESPGEIVFKRGRKYKEYRGMGSISAMEKRENNRYRQNPDKRKEYIPEGVEGLVPYKGEVSEIIYQLVGGLKSSMGYLGAEKLEEMPKKAKIHKLTKSGKSRSHPHSLEVTRETPNYSPEDRDSF